MGGAKREGKTYRSGLGNNGWSLCYDHWRTSDRCSGGNTNTTLTDAIVTRVFAYNEAITWGLNTRRIQTGSPGATLSTDANLWNTSCCSVGHITEKIFGSTIASPSTRGSRSVFEHVIGVPEIPCFSTSPPSSLTHLLLRPSVFLQGSKGRINAEPKWLALEHCCWSKGNAFSRSFRVCLCCRQSSQIKSTKPWWRKKMGSLADVDWSNISPPT